MRVYFFLIFLLLSLVVILNILSFSYYIKLNRILGSGINSFASNEGTVSLSVEGVDTTSPEISITDPTATTYSSHRTSISYTVSDNLELDSCWYTLNSGITNVSITCGNNVSSITSLEGANTWTVYANDTSDNENSSSISFTVSTASPSSQTSGGGGGGGGGGYTGVTNIFSLIPEELNMIAISGESQSAEIIATNFLDSQLVLDIEIIGIENIVSIDTTRLIIAPGESKPLTLSILTSDSGVYAGRIIFRSGNIAREVFVLINARSADALFDVSLTLPQSYKVVRPGDNLRAFISLLQVGPAGEVDVTINYFIKSFDGNLISSESETFRILESKSFTKDFSIPELPAGDYLVAIEVTYPGGFASSSSHFSVQEFKINSNVVIAVISILIFFIVIGWTILKYKRSKKYLARRR